MVMWTAYPTHPVAYREGSIHDAEPGAVSSYVAEHIMRAGCGVIRGTADPQVDHPLALPAVDADGLVTAAVMIANPAGLRINTIAEFNGVGPGGGKTEISPPRQVRVTFAAGGGVNEWDTVTGEHVTEIFGRDANGDPIHEQIVKPNGTGAQVYDTVQYFSFVDVIDQQATLGGVGTGTIGTTAAVEYGRRDFVGISVYDSLTPPPATANYDCDATLPIAVLHGRGKIGAIPEDNVVAGESVYMRVVVGAGALIRGRFTGDLQADDANFARVLNCRWDTTTAAGAAGLIEVL